ncbi:MAG: hypothetical protein CMM30_06870 [Rhodospirillaceae bacterium]|nr:hypothetical protein [Rhodospirillaceae bacterium]
MGRMAVDIGGTFTDLVHFDDQTGALVAEKSLTTPKDLTNGVLNSIKLADIESETITFFVHGGTTVINAITERKGAKTALITTKGFRDVLEIARGNRPDLYNLRFQKPKPFVPRRLRFEVEERLDASGNIIKPLSIKELEDIVKICISENVEAIAVVFLHSYSSPQHEIICAEYLRKNLPDISITASHEITREWREYERANTAVLNAYVQPTVQKYFNRLQSTLLKQGFNCPMHAMQSNGGSASFTWAKSHPITLVESGPSAGVNAAALVGSLCKEDNVIYLDIGGTTAKCSVIKNNQIDVTTEYKLEWSRINPGYPVKVPVVDIVEIGTGGGSIAWFDEVGSLKVGPVSAGAEPGPACYSQGGSKPTVTDAKLITGVLDPDYFAGGRIKLDIQKAKKAMETIAKGLNTDVISAAESVIRLADADMINALKLISIQRGHDPRDFVLVVGGGGGAMHAATLGRDLGVREVIVPRYPGYFSAWGMLATEPRRDFVMTHLMRADKIRIGNIKNIFDELRNESYSYFKTDKDIVSSSIRLEARIDLRYQGQEHWVGVPVNINSISIDKLIDDFHVEHERTYTFKLDNSPIELVNFHLTATASVPRPHLNEISSDNINILKGRRRVLFSEDGEHETQVLDRESLPAGYIAKGPLLIEEKSATTLIHPGQKLRVDEIGFLHIS